MITSLSLRFITVSFYQKKTFPSTFISYLFEQKTKIVHAVVVANIPNDLSEDIVILRELTVLYPGAQQIAQDPAEILMSGVGQEGSGVRQHAHESGHRFRDTFRIIAF